MNSSFSNRPVVSILIPCRNERAHIEHCLRSILKQVEPEDGFEVIVADGMSTDGTREVLRGVGDGRWEMAPGPGGARRPGGGIGAESEEDDGAGPKDQRAQGLRAPGTQGLRDSGSQGPRVPESLSPRVPESQGPFLRVIENPGRIVSTGLNAAIKAARGEIIVRMDAHTEYALDYVQQCVAVLQETGADNVGGPARTRAATYLEKAVAAAYHSPFAVGGARFHDFNYEGWVDTVTYGCWRREAFKRFGYFDEELVRNQDDEHNLRIIRGGGKIWQSPKIKSWYRPRGSLSALFKQYMQYGYWKVRVIQKHRLPASWRHLVPGAFVLTLLVLILLSVFSFLLSGFAAVPESQGPLVPGSFGPLVPWSLGPFIALCSLLLAYVLAVLGASLHTAARTEWKLLPILPFVFPCYHFGYGWGFLRGVLDFMVLRRRPQARFGQLTR